MSRRSVVAAAAWGVPAVSLASATPAFANTSQATNVTISGPSGGVPASGAVPVTVTVKDAQGQPQAGQPVSFSGPDGSSFDAADGVTNGAGQYTANFNLNKPWAEPGSTVAVTAVSGGGNASQSFGVIGANALAFGRSSAGELGDGGSYSSSSVARTQPTQLLPRFPSPVKQMAGTGGGADYYWSYNASYALLEDGTVWSSGGNYVGILGYPTDVQVERFTRIPGLTDVVQLAAESLTGHALLADGSVMGWGNNYFGSLGTGTSSQGSSATPIPLPGISDATQIATSSQNFYILRSDKTVWALGRGGANLGTGNKNSPDANTPVQVSGLTSVAQISGSYALKEDGTVWSWGSNYSGALGSGTTPVPPRWSQGQPDYSSATPVQVQGLSGLTVVSIAAFDGGCFALTSGGAVLGWGDNESGTLGDGTTVSKSQATQVTGLTSGVSVLSAAGLSGYVIKSDGTVWAWGANDLGQLGDGTTTNQTAPVRVAGLAGRACAGLMSYSPRPRRMFVITGESALLLDVPSQTVAGQAATVKATVSSGAAGIADVPVTLAATANAALGASSGQTDSTGVFTTWVTPDVWTVPGATFKVSGSTDSSSSSRSSVVLGANALAFGRETGYELGDQGANGPQSGSSSVSRTTPTQLYPSFPSPIKQIAGTGWGDSYYSYNNTFALLQDGTVWTVGGNYAGQSGDGTDTYHASWTQIPGLTNVKQISAANLTAFALLATGKVMGWGANYFGQIGTGTPHQGNSDVPIEIAGLSNVTKVSSGSQTTHFLLQDQTVWSLGRGGAGLGTGNSNEPDASTPVQVTGLSSVIDIAGRTGGGYALKSDGTVWAWGANYSGALGSGTSPVPPRWSQGVPEYSSATPVQVTGLAGKTVTAIAGRADGGLALTSDGAVYAWGDNQSGTVGDGTTTSRSVATLVSGLASDVERIYCSGLTSYAIKNDGSPWAWGDNSFGQLGNGSTNNSSTPVAISGLGGKYVTSFMTDAPTPWRQYAIVGPSTVTVNTASTQLTAGQTTVVQAKVAAGSQGVSGATVTVTATGTATISTPSGQTDSSGLFETSVTPDQWSRPGSVVRLTAASGASSGQKTATVLGGNYLAAGTNVWGGAGVRDNGWSLQMTTPQQAAPVFPSPVVQVAADTASAIVLLADGSVWGVGQNNYRQSAPGSTNTGLPWAAIPGISTAVQVALGDYSGHALLSNGTVVSWGKDEDNFGVLGISGASLLTTPTVIPGLSGVTQIYAGDASVFALKSDGTVWGWGAGTQGRLGLGSSAAVKNDTPQHIPVPATIVEIVSGRWQAWARDTSGNVWAWGRNNDGGLGVGAAGNDVTSPVKLSGITSAAALGAGIVLLTNGTVVSWSAGQTPSAVPGLTGVQQVCANAVFGGSYYAVTSSGVVAWGKNDAGQLGDGTTTDRSAPVSVTGLNGRGVTKVFTSFRGEKAFFLAQS